MLADEIKNFFSQKNKNLLKFNFKWYKVCSFTIKMLKQLSQEIIYKKRAEVATANKAYGDSKKSVKRNKTQS